MTSQILFDQNSMVLELQGLKDSVSDTYINTATVAVTLVDSDDVNVVGETWPLTMIYVASSNGNYRAILPDTLTLAVGSLYAAKISATGGVDLVGYWKWPLVVESRDFL